MRSAAWQSGSLASWPAFPLWPDILRHDAVDALFAWLLGQECQAEFFADHRCQKTTDRVRLPAGRLHDRGDRCSLGLSEESKNGFLLGPAAGRRRGKAFGLRRSFRNALGAGMLGLCEGFAMRHWRILLVVTALSAVTTEAPQWRHRQRGRIPGEPKPAALSAPRSDALFAPEVHFFLRGK